MVACRTSGIQAVPPQCPEPKVCGHIQPGAVVQWTSSSDDIAAGELGQALLTGMGIGPTGRVRGGLLEATEAEGLPAL